MADAQELLMRCFVNEDNPIELCASARLGRRNDFPRCGSLVQEQIGAKHTHKVDMNPIAHDLFTRTILICVYSL